MGAWRWREFLLLLTAFIFSVGFASVGFLLLLVLVAGEVISGEPLWRRTPLDGGLAALVTAAFLSALGSESRPAAVGAAVLLALSAAVTIRAVVLASNRSPGFAGRFLGWWAAGGVVAALAAIVGMGPTVDARAQVFNMDPIELGTTLAIAAVLLLGLSLDGPRLRRLLCLGSLLPVTAALVLTWSRGAWLAAILGTAALAVRTHRRRLWPGLLAAVLVLGAALPTLGPRWAWHADRLLDIAAAEGRFSRIAIWRLVPAIVADHPVVGTGLSTFQTIYERYRPPNTEMPPGTSAHNLFLQFAAETGLVGLAALLAFLTVGGVALARWHARWPPGGAQHRTSAIVLAAFVALLAHQMVDGTVLRIHIAVGLYALMALGAAGAMAAGEAAR